MPHKCQVCLILRQSSKESLKQFPLHGINARLLMCKCVCKLSGLTRASQVMDTNSIGAVWLSVCPVPETKPFRETPLMTTDRKPHTDLPPVADDLL